MFGHEHMRGSRTESRHSSRAVMALAPGLSPLLILSCILLAPLSHAADKSGVGLNKISLPSGPGSIEGLGDAFEPQLNSGTSSYSVKIAAPPGVAGLQPNVVLRYNSGGGNGPFGVAWSAGLLSIQRQVEKGLPNYGDGDTFTLGGEELVLLTDGSYRTENESAFQRIIRDGSGWIIYDKNGTRSYLGSLPIATNPSRIVRPGGGQTFSDTFKWCVDQVIDVNGNRMEYSYSTFTDSPGDIYCSEIRYSIFGANYHSIAFDWEQRPDAFGSFLSGFQVRTGRRCNQIRVLSNGALVRRYGLSYTLPADDPIEPIGANDAGQLFSQLRQVTQFDNGPDNSNYLPPLRLGYTRFDPANIASGSFINPWGISLGSPEIAIADINADGLPDFFHTNPLTSQHQVIYNQGLGRFSSPTSFVSQPSGITLGQGNADLVDYDGDGKIDLVQKSGTTGIQFVFFPNTTRLVDNPESQPAWGAEHSFTGQAPPFDLDDPSVRTLDLDNDKRMDFMRTTAGGFIYYLNRGTSWEENGLFLFGEPEMGDITYADGIDFTDGIHVKLADLNGDRLLDLCRINLFQNLLELTYWPNKGHGSWGNGTPMTGTIDIGTVPIDDVYVRDLNGDGLADVMTVAYDHVDYWINLGNDGFSRKFEVSNTPAYIRGTTVLRQADFNGNGTTDLLWENFDSSVGGYRESWVDFVGGAKPNLLAVIDNGIGLRTEISYRPSTDYYVAAMLGSNPWRTRLPFPNWCVSKITKRFGLDLDAIPGEDRYITEFSYYDGYYDPFEKEFRGFAFARKVERGDDRLTDGGPAAVIHSPSTVTRFAFHTGLPDGIDNDGDGLTDEFNEVSGYEEESLKGKVLWTETTALTEEFDGIDNDGDGFIDESDEGPGSGYLSPNSNVFSRAYQTWSLKTIHDPSGGFTQGAASLPFGTADGRKVTFPFSSAASTQTIEGPGPWAGNSYGTATTPVTSSSRSIYDFFGNQTSEENDGVVSGGAVVNDDERYTHTDFGFNLSAWIIGLPTETRVTDENGVFVSKTRNFYDDQAFGQIGSKGLMTSEQSFIDASTSLTSNTIYDTYGNPTTVRDPAYSGSGNGHERVYGYDPTFHTYVETETIKVGNGSPDLIASATYNKGGGVITSSSDFNTNVSSYLYDSFFRLTGIVKPGDSTGSPTQVFQYQPGDPVRSLAYNYTSSGALSLSVSSATPVVSQVSVKSRETVGGGTFDIVQITDGAGHKLGTIEEGATSAQFVYKDVKRYTSRGAERDSYLPFFAGSPDFRNPPPDGDRVSNFYDAVGRAVRTVNPPETTGGRQSETQTVYLPLKTVLFDEEDTYVSSPHYGTPHVQYKDGLDRLRGVDELAKLTDAGQPGALATWPTRYRYDLNDQLTGITDSQNNVKSMLYDGLKRMTFMDDPDRSVMNYIYDDASNLTDTIDAKAQHIVMTYDGANRIKTEDYLDAAGKSPDVSYTYDTVTTVPAGDGSNATSAHVKGKLSFVTDLSGAEILSYDSRGRTAWKIKRVPDPSTGVLSSYKSGFTYDSLDRLTDLTYPDGDNVGYGYNARNLPQNITGGPGGFVVSDMDYKASGQLDTTTYGNGVATSYHYDPRLRLRSLNTVKAATQLISFSYAFDGASNITRIDDNRAAIAGSDPRKNTQIFGYDDLYRLTNVQYPALLSGSAGNISYAYDRIGNMLGQTSNITATENGLPLTNLGTMSYGGTIGPIGRIGRNGGQPGPHALTAVSGGSRSYPYDANGNMETIDGMACTWDFKDRLVAVENSTMRADYTYDYTDRRITKKVTPKTLSTLNPSLSTSVSYIDRTYELREDGSPVKYVWNGETRVARVTTNLNASQRLQRFTLQPGWNLCTLAVALTNAGTQLNVAPVQNVYRYDPAAQTYVTIAANEALPAGTLLRVRASSTGELAVRGTPAAAASVNYPAGRHWIGNATFQPLVLATALPADPPLWFFDANTQAWRYRLPSALGTASDAPARLEPGEAIFVLHAAAFTLAPADPTLEVRYYHQDHLGSSSVMTDATGQLVSESTFYPFGHPRNEHEPRNLMEAYGFTQKERDGESGLNYFEARFLSSAIPSFISVDPAVQALGLFRLEDPRLNHPYSYSGSNPITYTDPNGKWVGVDNFIAGGVSAGVEIASQYISAQVSGKEFKPDYANVGAAFTIGFVTTGLNIAAKALPAVRSVILSGAINPATSQVTQAVVNVATNKLVQIAATGATKDVGKEFIARGISYLGVSHEKKDYSAAARDGSISELLGAGKFMKGASKELTQEVLGNGVGQLSRNAQKRLYESVERSGIPEKVGEIVDHAAEAFTQGTTEGVQERLKGESESAK